MINRLPAFVAIALTVGLFVVGGKPDIGHAFPGVLHWIAHLASYGVIAAAYALALPRLGFLWIAAIVAGLGAAHEFYEIEAHGHDFEVADALVNAVGALAGSLAVRARGLATRRRKAA